MGWTTLHRDKGISNADFFFAGGQYATAGKYVVHASGTVGTVFYAAVSRTDKPEEVLAFVALTSWSPNSYYNFGYKDMDETVMPFYFEAPEAVLDALTDTDNLTALEWRQRCRDHHAQRKGLRNLRDGDVVVLDKAVGFTDGSTQDHFTIRRHRTRGNGTRVVLTANGAAYRLPDWQDAAVAVVRDGVSTPTHYAEIADELAYAARVERLWWDANDRDAAREAMKTRYGVSHSSVTHLARAEFREGNVWPELESFEPVPV